MPEIEVLVVGGGLGGVSAALAAAQAGVSVVLVEPSSWLGGQMSGQGVCTPDEAGINGVTVMNTCGSTATYQQFRTWVRGDYSAMGMNAAAAKIGPPGDNWTSNDGFGVEAARAHNIFSTWLQEAGVTVMLGASVSVPVLQGGAITSMTVTDSSGRGQVFNPNYVLDATETGDLLPMLGLAWVIGAEADGFQGETNDQAVAEPTWIQPITYPFAVEYQPNNTVPTMQTKPAGYEGLAPSFDLFGDTTTMYGEYTGFMTYRRVISQALFPASAFAFDLSMVNVGSNDYVQGIYPTGDPTADEAALQAAQQVSTCFLYYLQNDAPRTQGGAPAGWPEIVPKSDFFTNSYLAPLPYIREARRINAMGYVVKDDILRSGPEVTQRAKLFADSCGLGNYAMDVHSINADKGYWPTNPFQIRVSQLVPTDCSNLLASGKCLGVTHVTNGAFRLHPQEWNIGEAAGTLAAFCIGKGVSPAEVATTDSQLTAFQMALLKRGVPLYWWTDVDHTAAEWPAIQILGVRQIFSGDAGTLNFLPNQILTAQEMQELETAAGVAVPWPSASPTRAAGAQAVASALGLT